MLQELKTILPAIKYNETKLIVLIICGNGSFDIDHKLFNIVLKYIENSKKFN